MIRYKLHTLLIVLALGPALIAGAWYLVAHPPWSNSDSLFDVDLNSHPYPFTPTPAAPPAK